MSKELGKKLKELRSAMGYTQNQIAKQLNVDRSTYSNYERAVTEPDIKTLITLKRVFGVDANELLSDGDKITKVAESKGIPMYTLTRQEQDFIIRLRLLNDDQKKAAFDFINGFFDGND